MMLAVQVTEDGPWHAATDERSRITRCGKHQPFRGWVEYKSARFVVNEKWCLMDACVNAFNEAIRDSV